MCLPLRQQVSLGLWGAELRCFLHPFSEREAKTWPTGLKPSRSPAPFFLPRDDRVLLRPPDHPPGRPCAWLSAGSVRGADSWKDCKETARLVLKLVFIQQRVLEIYPG